MYIRNNSITIYGINQGDDPEKISQILQREIELLLEDDDQLKKYAENEEDITKVKNLRQIVSNM